MNFLKRFWKWLRGNEVPKELKPQTLQSPIQPSEKTTLSMVPSAKIERITDQIREEEIRRHYFPTPPTKRRTRNHSHSPPAERHRSAISKHMKGKGRFSKTYRRTIKNSPNILIEED